MAGIEEAFEKFSDRLAREESKRYSRDEQGDYVEEVQDPYPIKLGPLELGANANMSTGKFSPNEYQNVSTMNRNVGLRGKYNVPDSGIALLGSIGDVRSNQNVRTNLPFNPMTGEASPYSEMRKDVYKDSPYSVGAQYNPQGTDEMYSALYNKGGGYNLGYNKGPVNVSYTSNPGLGNNVMLRGQYNFADGGVANMFRERPEYSLGGPIKAIRKIGGPTQKEIDDFVNMPVAMGQFIGPDALPGEDYGAYVRRKRAETGPPLFEAIRDPNVIPLNAPGVAPRLETTPQVDVSANPIARALEMAGFTKEEIMRILGQQGFAEGGIASMFRERPGYQVGGNIDPMLTLQTPLDAARGYGYSDPVISALTGNIFTSGQRVKDVFNPRDITATIQQAQAAGYSQPEIEELKRLETVYPGFEHNLAEIGLGQTNPQQFAIDFANSIRTGTEREFFEKMFPQTQQPVQQSNQQFFQQPVQQQVVTQQPQMSYNEMQKANYARRIGELEDKFAKQGTSATKYIQDMTNLIAQMKNSGGIDPLGAMQSKYYTGPSSGSVSEGRGIDANFVINRVQQSERDAAARVTPTRMAEGGRVGYAFGGMMKQALSQIGDQLAEKLPPEQQEAIVKANLNEGGIGGIFRNIISRVSDVLGKVVKKQSTATPAAGLAIPLDRPVQSGDPIGSYYANPNNPALSSIAPPTTNPLTRPLSTAGFYGSEIFDILKRLGFNFADGGRVSMSEGGLTTTVPPAKGPDSQGVESLFRRRYN